MRSLVAFTLVILILGNGCATDTNTLSTPTMPPQSVSLPLSDAPQIDGEITTGEWDDAIIKTFSDQSQLFLMRDEEYLYLAIRSATEEMIAANIYLAEGYTISIHHASAALGTAIYQKDADMWLKMQDFRWQCRATNDSESAIAERELFLHNEGWLAANSRIGTPNELEYQIKINGGFPSLAVSFMRSSSPDIRIYFPTDLNDGTTESAPNGLPEKGPFLPNTWERLNFSD